MPVTLQAANQAADTREQPAPPVVLAPPRETRPRRYRHRRVAGLLARMRWISYHDSLFERPDFIEDDYYRLRNQSRD